MDDFIMMGAAKQYFDEQVDITTMIEIFSKQLLKK